MGGINLLEARRNILMSQPHITTESANPLTFQTDISASIKGGKVYFTPIQEGSGDPSPDNVRPISGWNGIDMYHYGANLFPLTLPSTAFKGTFGTGASSISSATYGRVWTMYVGENQNLYYQHGSISPTVMFAFSDKPLTTRTGAVIYNALNCSSRNNVLLNSTTHPYLVIAIANSTMLTPETGGLDNASAMLSFGNTRKSYEKRTDPLSLTLPFPQTIYGGYVDLVNGKLVETWSRLTPTTANTTVRSNTSKYPYFMRTTLAGNGKVTSVMSNVMKILTVSQFSTADIGFENPNNTYVMYWVHPDCATQEGANALRSDTSIEFVYQRREPIHHQLTPETIKTLKGINNIWSNANGNIEVKFWKH